MMNATASIEEHRPPARFLVDGHLVEVGDLPEAIDLDLADLYELRHFLVGEVREFRRLDGGAATVRRVQ